MNLGPATCHIPVRIRRSVVADLQALTDLNVVVPGPMTQPYVTVGIAPPQPGISLQ